MVDSTNEKTQRTLKRVEVQPEIVNSETSMKIRDLVTLTRKAHILAKQLQKIAKDKDPMVSDYYSLTFASAEASKHAEYIFKSRCMPKN